MSILGIMLHPNKTDSYFDVDAMQYTSHYKVMKELSIFPTRAHFTSKRYKGRKLILGHNINICVEGFLYKMDTDESGRPARFHLEVNNVHFLNTTVVSPKKELPSLSTTNPSARFRFTHSATQLAEVSSPGRQLQMHT
jgi:hypothetical protein